MVNKMTQLFVCLHCCRNFFPKENAKYSISYMKLKRWKVNFEVVPGSLKIPYFIKCSIILGQYMSAKTFFYTRLKSNTFLLNFLRTCARARESSSGWNLLALLLTRSQICVKGDLVFRDVLCRQFTIQTECTMDLILPAITILGGTAFYKHLLNLPLSFSYYQICPQVLS